jgi:hypothetical protein
LGREVGGEVGVRELLEVDAGGAVVGDQGREDLQGVGLGLDREKEVRIDDVAEDVPALRGVAGGEGAELA